MKLAKTVLSFLLALTLLFGVQAYAAAATIDYSNSTDEVIHYDYPIVPGTDEWSQLETHQEMLAAVQVPEEILKKMTTGELVTTVLENPMIVDIYAYYTPEDGFSKGYEILCDNLNCLRELDSRSDSIDCLYDELSGSNSEKILSISGENSDDVESMYMTGERILQCMLIETKSNVEKLSISNNYIVSTQASMVTVLTPKNSAVTVYAGLTWTDHGITSSEATTQTNAIMNRYPNAVKIEDKSPVYNCHNFAWNTSNPKLYWMNDPGKYMSDGSYTKTGSALSNYRVYYPNGGHSAIIKSNNDDNIYVKSKWGALPAFEHNVHYSPYDDTGITFWKKS